MPRTRIVHWVYECDTCNDRERRLEVFRGDRRPTGRSLHVNDQSDADAVARQQGWLVGTRMTCPRCVTVGGAA